MSEGTFLTFPLCLLAMDAQEKDRLQLMLADSMERAGKQAGSIDAAQIGGYVAQHNVQGLDQTSPLHCSLVRGAIVLNVSMGHIHGTEKRLKEAHAFQSSFERKHGTSPLVFISSALFWGCHDRDEPTYREFTTLCAVNSVIGFKKSPILIRRGMIIARQLGFKTPAALSADPLRKTALTVRQIRDILDALEGRELIARCQASRRNVYFSTMLPADELRSKVKQAMEQKAKVRLRRELDRAELSATTTGPQQGHLKMQQPEKAEKGPLKNKGPQQGQNGTTTGSTEGTTTGATEISAVKEMPSNKGSLTNDGNAGDRVLSEKTKREWYELRARLEAEDPEQ